MDSKEFGRWSHAAADWSTRYLNEVADYPVRSQQMPGSLLDALPDAAPETADSMEQIFEDFERLIPSGMTHWQHPRFFAYFPSNAAPAAILAEQLAASLAAQCMLWQTSPAATELEIRMVDWLRQAVGLPDTFTGSFQDTASTSTLCAVLVMRERALDYSGNRSGLSGQPRLRIYASGRTHSSVDKALWVAGLGQDNLVKIPTGDGPLYPMSADALSEAIAADRAAGHVPAGVVVCVGGTSTGATDNAKDIVAIAQREGLYCHVDAAWAGAAMICPEFRELWAGVEGADSIVLNPHKWLGTGMECSAHFVRDPESLVKTLAIQPEYLKTRGADGVVNFSEWSVQLGRRFRALKVWFLLRAYGLEGLREMIRNHVLWSVALCERLRLEADMQIVTEPVLSLFSFRHRAPAGGDADAHNLEVVQRINDDGRIYLTQTRHDDGIAIRFQAGQFDTSEADFDLAFDVITSLARAPHTSRH